MLSYLDSIKRKIEKISRVFRKTHREVDLTREKGERIYVFFWIEIPQTTFDFIHFVILMDFNFFCDALKCGIWDFYVDFVVAIVVNQ